MNVKKLVKKNVVKYSLCLILALPMSIGITKNEFDFFKDRYAKNTPKSKRFELVKNTLLKLDGKAYLDFKRRVVTPIGENEMLFTFAGLSSAFRGVFSEMNSDSLVSLLSKVRLKVYFLDFFIKNNLRGALYGIQEGEVDFTEKGTKLVFYINIKDSSLIHLFQLQTIAQHEALHIIFEKYLKKNKKEIGFEGEIPPISFQQLFSPKIRGVGNLHSYRIPLPNTSYGHFMTLPAYCFSLDFYDKNKTVYEENIEMAEKLFFSYFKEVMKNKSFYMLGKLELLIPSMEENIRKIKKKNSKKLSSFSDFGMSYKEGFLLKLEKFLSSYVKAKDFEERFITLKAFLGETKGANGLIKNLNELHKIRNLTLSLKNKYLEGFFCFIIDGIVNSFITTQSLENYIASKMVGKYSPYFIENYKKP